jgi:hypothetical protein
MSTGLFIPNVLLVSGSGRDCGKTTLACNIIQNWKDREKMVAVKISAHTHDHSIPMNLVHREEGFAVWEERAVTQKDSGRFLAAGADRVFYLETSDDKLLSAFWYIYEGCQPGTLILCESGGLGKYIRPGVMLFVQQADELVAREKAAIRALSHAVVFSGSPEMDDPARILRVTDHTWQLITPE